MDDKWRLTEDQLKKMLLVTNVVIGAPLLRKAKMKQARVLNDKELRAVLNSTKLTRYQHRNRLMVMLSYCAGLTSLRDCQLAYWGRYRQ